MATFVVCLQCGKVQEIDIVDQLPKGWRRSQADLFCSYCADTSVLDGAAASDVLDEEVIYPPATSAADTLDEGYCEICGGPCQGH